MLKEKKSALGSLRHLFFFFPVVVCFAKNELFGQGNYTVSLQIIDSQAVNPLFNIINIEISIN